MIEEYKPKAAIWLLVCCLSLSLCLIEAANEQSTSSQPSRLLLRPSLRAANRQQQQPATQGTAVEVSPPINVLPPTVAINRTARTAADESGNNIQVTNTCERESMKINIRTSKAFHGVIHTRNQRQKPGCSVEGNGATEYNVEISHVLNSADPSYCGVIRARRDSPEDKDTLSVVVAVRLHRNIERSDDKFFLLNCTNRCRKPDCSSPSAKLLSDSDETGRANNPDAESGAGSDEREGNNNGAQNSNKSTGQHEECTIYNFPWVITLLWCLGILLLAMIISHCIMCSSMVCKCVKTEVEETAPSEYEGATDYEDDLYNNKRHPYRIDYDNRDIYKTSNNYEPYCLEDTDVKTRHKSHKKSLR